MSSESTAQDWKAQCNSIATKLSAAAEAAAAGAAEAHADIPTEANSNGDHDADSTSGQLTALANQVSFMPVLLGHQLHE